MKRLILGAVCAAALLAVVDDDNAVVMEVKVDADTLRDWLNDHDAMRRGIHAGRHGEN